MTAQQSSEKAKPYVAIGIIGHMSHGKTTLIAAMRKVAALKGLGQLGPSDQIDKASVDEPAELAGTISPVEYETEKCRYAHFENPGHIDYLTNRITGAILVVSAPDGPTPQTRAHLLLARQVEAPVIGVFLSKVDEMPDPELLELVESEVQELLGQYGFPGDEIPIVQGSALQALESPSKDLSSPEYAPILELMRVLDEYILDLAPKVVEPLRMAIEDVFSIKGRGTVVIGRVERGAVKEGQELEIVGPGRPTKKTVVTDVEVSDKILPKAQAGETVGLLLRGIEPDEVERGMVIATPETIQPHTTFEADVYVLKKEEGGRRRPFLGGEQPQFYIRGRDVTGTVELPVDTEMAMPGDRTTLRVALDVPVALEEGARFAIREGGLTVGAGVLTRILDEVPDRPRQVRIGITETDPPEEVTDADVLLATQPLAQGKSYYLRIDISAKSGATNVVNPVAIPSEALERIPDGSPLEVVVYSKDFEIPEEGPYRNLQELKLPSGNRASAFVYVRITAPDEPRVANLSVCVFYHNALLQWLTTRARVVPASEEWDTVGQLTQVTPHLPELAAFGVTTVTQLSLLSDHDVHRLAQELNAPINELSDWRDEAEQLGQLGNESRVVYTISPTFADFEAFESPTVTILFDGAKGEVKVKGPGKSPPLCQVIPGLKNSLLEFREMMAAINEPEEKVYAFQPDNEGSSERTPGLLLQMADMGRTLYNVVFNDNDAQQYLRHALEKEGTIEVSQISSDYAVVPWSTLYDLTLIEEWEAKQEGTPRQACMLWASESHQEASQGEDGVIQYRLDYETCINGAGCPRRRRDDESDDKYEARVSCNVCVYGFWGFKHRLQQPLGSREEQENPETLPRFIPVAKQPRVDVIGNSQITYYPKPHQEILANLREGPMNPTFEFADTHQKIKATLKDSSAHVLYFYCHGDMHRSLPRLIVGNDDVFISGDTLSRWVTDKWDNTPLVFINGCETITYSAESLTSMALQFRGRNASGIIGTEIEVFPMLAKWFGEQFMRHFLAGEPVGKIMLDLRRELLEKFNPLGLIYTNHTLAGLRLIDQKLAQPYLRRARGR